MKFSIGNSEFNGEKNTMMELLTVFLAVDIAITFSALLIISIDTYEKGYWHWPNKKLPFIPYRYTYYESDGNTRYIKIFVGNTYIHTHMKIGMTPDGMFDYHGMEIDGIGSSFDVKPPKGTNILEVNKALKYLLEEVPKKADMSVTIDTKCSESMQKYLSQIDNLKYAERVGNEQK